MKKNIFVCISIIVLMTGCNDNSKNKSSMLNTNIPTPTLPSLNKPSIHKPGIEKYSNLTEHAAELADAVKGSQARLASRDSEYCPKLIDFSVGSSKFVKHNEVMRRNSCKYYLYPEAGDTLHVQLENRKMKAQLGQPKRFEFDNNAYVVKNPGKHVLEIRYKNPRRNNAPDTYNLEVTKG